MVPEVSSAKISAHYCGRTWYLLSLFKQQSSFPNIRQRIPHPSMEPHQPSPPLPWLPVDVHYCRNHEASLPGRTWYLLSLFKQQSSFPNIRQRIPHPSMEPHQPSPPLPWLPVDVHYCRNHEASLPGHLQG